VNPRSRPADDGTAGGFTIVEVLVAITVLVVAMIGAALLFENAILASGNTRNRVVAANLATAQMETVRGQASDPTQFTAIAQGQTVTTPVVNGITYTVTQDVQFVGQSSTTSSCDTPTAASGQIMQVSEEVSWNDMAGTAPVRSVSTLSPPVGAYSATSGSIAVKLFDASGVVSENISVQVVGPTTLTQQTTSEGCAYFAFLPVGTYTVTVVEGTGVGDQEVVAPAQTASISVGQTASLQFQYDKPGTVVATLPSPTNTPGAPPHATGMSISVANTGLQPYGQFTFAAAASGDVTTSPGLFPYSSGYTVYAGNCTDNNPLGKDTSRNPFYPTAAPIPVSVPPGGSVANTVPLYTVSAHVQNSTGVAQPAATMTAQETSFAAPYSAVCTSGTATGSAPTLGLVTTNATGDSVTSMPLGHWTLNARAGTKIGSVNVWVKPDGVYAVNASGVATTKFTGPVVVVVS
jgi:Tfp pilus assembly protein PilV